METSLFDGIPNINPKFDENVDNMSLVSSRSISKENSAVESSVAETAKLFDGDRTKKPSWYYKKEKRSLADNQKNTKSQTDKDNPLQEDWIAKLEQEFDTESSKNVSLSLETLRSHQTLRNYCHREGIDFVKLIRENGPSALMGSTATTTAATASTSEPVVDTGNPGLSPTSSSSSLSATENINPSTEATRIEKKAVSTSTEKIALISIKNSGLPSDRDKSVASFTVTNDVDCRNGNAPENVPSSKADNVPNVPQETSTNAKTTTLAPSATPIAAGYDQPSFQEDDKHAKANAGLVKKTSGGRGSNPKITNVESFKVLSPPPAKNHLNSMPARKSATFKAPSNAQTTGVAGKPKATRAASLKTRPVPVILESDLQIIRSAVVSSSNKQNVSSSSTKGPTIKAPAVMGPVANQPKNHQIKADSVASLSASSNEEKVLDSDEFYRLQASLSAANGTQQTSDDKDKLNAARRKTRLLSAHLLKESELSTSATVNRAFLKNESFTVPIPIINSTQRDDRDRHDDSLISNDTNVSNDNCRTKNIRAFVKGVSHKLSRRSNRSSRGNSREASAHSSRRSSLSLNRMASVEEELCVPGARKSKSARSITEIAHPKAQKKVNDMQTSPTKSQGSTSSQDSGSQQELKRIIEKIKTGEVDKPSKSDLIYDGKRQVDINTNVDETELNATKQVFASVSDKDQPRLKAEKEVAKLKERYQQVSEHIQALEKELKEVTEKTVRAEAVLAKINEQT